MLQIIVLQKKLQLEEPQAIFKLKKLNKKIFKKIINDKLENKSYILTHQDRFIYIVNTINSYFKKNKNKIVLDFGSHTGAIGLLLQNYG